MPTILKIEHGTIDRHGRFHKSRGRSGSGVPSGLRLPSRSVSRLRTANPHRAPVSGTSSGSDALYNHGYMDQAEFRSTMGATKGFNRAMDRIFGKGWKGRFTKGAIAEFKSYYTDGRKDASSKSKNPAAQLKALLGEGKWTQAKVRPIKGGKVQVLLARRENPKGKAVPVIDFYYTGDIEVGTGGPGYRWVAGYQSKSENGNWYYPPMTYRDSQKWAKSQGAKAKFHGDRRYQTTRRENPKAGARGLSEEDIAAVKRDLPSLVAKRGKKTYTVKLGGRLNEKASAAVTDERRGSGRGVWWAPVMGPIFHVSWEAAARAYKTGKPLKV